MRHCQRRFEVGGPCADWSLAGRWARGGSGIRTRKTPEESADYKSVACASRRAPPRVLFERRWKKLGTRVELVSRTLLGSATYRSSTRAAVLPPPQRPCGEAIPLSVWQRQETAEPQGRFSCYSQALPKQLYCNMGPRLLLLAGLLAISTTCATANTGFTGTHLDYTVMRALTDVQREFATETVYCLQGFVEDGVVWVNDLSTAVIRNASRNAVTFVRCSNDDNVVGWYHNHPDLGYCTFSKSDKAVHNNRGYPIAVLSCLNHLGRIAFVVRFADEDAEYLFDTVELSLDQALP